MSRFIKIVGNILDNMDKTADNVISKICFILEQGNQEGIQPVYNSQPYHSELYFYYIVS